MDAVTILIFVISTFAAALVAGVAGFAFGLVASAVWLHLLSPDQTAMLVITLGTVVQTIAVWKLRRSLSWNRLWPYVIGGAIGVPIGVSLVSIISPGVVKVSIGFILVAYSSYGLMGRFAQTSSVASRYNVIVGVLNGLVGGLTGLSAIVVTVWSGMQGWNKDMQRATFQPTAVAVFIMSGLLLGMSKPVPPNIGTLFSMGLPALAAGNWLGLRLYGGISEHTFRKIILVLLMISGIALIAHGLF